MSMNITAEQAEIILTGSHKFSQLGLSMMITRLKSIYAKDASQEVLQKCTEEINEFLRKYSSILTADYVIISKL